jgi:hypothetical protein
MDLIRAFNLILNEQRCNRYRTFAWEGRLQLNEPSEENPERMGERESHPEAVETEGCLAEGEGRDSLRGFAAAAR